MKPVLLDFNGTLFSDTCFHMEAWSEIYRELHENTKEVPDSSFFCGPRNDDIIHAIAPDMPRAEREQCSVHKEALYRSICRKNPDKLHLTKGAEELLQYMKEHDCPYILASASIQANIDFYFETFHLERWLNKETCVYDDGTYDNKGEDLFNSIKDGTGKWNDEGMVEAGKLFQEEVNKGYFEDGFTGVSREES